MADRGAFVSPNLLYCRDAGVSARAIHSRSRALARVHPHPPRDSVGRGPIATSRAARRREKVLAGTIFQRDDWGRRRRLVWGDCDPRITVPASCLKTCTAPRESTGKGLAHCRTAGAREVPVRSGGGEGKWRASVGVMHTCSVRGAGHARWS